MATAPLSVARTPRDSCKCHRSPVSPLAATKVLEVRTQGGTQPPAQFRNGLESFQQCHIQRHSPWEMVLLFGEQERMGTSLVKSRVASVQAGFQSVGQFRQPQALTTIL